jgi:hypothetical protein
MLSSKLLISLCETIGKGNKFITFNDESKENEEGTIAAFMRDICYQFTAGCLKIGYDYLLSDEPLQDVIPDVIFSNVTDGGKTSMFGYIIDDAPAES